MRFVLSVLVASAVIDAPLLGAVLLSLPVSVHLCVRAVAVGARGALMVLCCGAVVCFGRVSVQCASVYSRCGLLVSFL